MNNRLTGAEMLSNKDILGTTRFKIMYVNGPHKGLFWRAPGSGTTRDPALAYAYTASTISPSYCVDKNVEFEYVNPPKPPEKEPEVKPVRLSVRQVKANLEELQDKQFRAWCGMGYAKNPLGTGTTHNLDEAARLKVGPTLRDWPKWKMQVELIDQECAKRISATKFKQCLIGEVLPAELITCISSMPTNPVYRALVMAKTNKMPPDDAVTFDAIKEWIEYNVEGPN